jgi:predicted MFS family arabinose efflux permease
LLTGNLAMALVVLPFVALAMGAPLAVVAIATALGFAGPTLLNVLWAAALQENVPEALLSRLSSYDWTISLAVLPLGSAAAGWSIDAWGVIPTLIWAAVFTLVPAVAALLDDEQRTFRRGGMASTSVPVSTTGRLAPAGTEDGR